MKFTVSAEALKLAAKRAALVIERLATIPILSHVLITAADGRVELFGTDMDMQISTAIEADITVPGRAAVDARSLVALSAGWTKGSLVELELRGGNLIVRNGSASSSLPTMPADDMPRMADKPREPFFAMPAALLLGQIARVRHAISTEETRYYLNGIYWHKHERKLRMVTTDGHRLAQTETAGAGGKMPGVIVPAGAVDVLRKLLGGKAAPPCGCEIGPLQLRFTVGSSVLTSKTIDGTFPDYQRVIPQNNEIVLTMVRRDLIDACARLVKLYPCNAMGAIKIDATAAGVELSVTSPDLGTASEHIAGRLKGKPIAVGFNGRYLLDTLNAMAGEDVTIALATASDPAVFTDPADNSALHVLMPMRCF